MLPLSRPPGTRSRTDRAHPRPAPSDSIFVTIIVKAPIVQLISIVLAIAIITLEYPAPFLKGTTLHRSFPIRIILLLLQTFFSILFYQVRRYAFMTSARLLNTCKIQGTNGALYSFVGALCYIRAQLNGEVMKEASANKGRGGKA